MCAGVGLVVPSLLQLAEGRGAELPGTLMRPLVHPHFWINVQS